MGATGGNSTIVAMKERSKPKKLAKKQAQKTLKEKRTEKRAKQKHSGI